MIYHHAAFGIIKWYLIVINLRVLAQVVGGRGQSVGTHHFLVLPANFEMRSIFSFSIGVTPKKGVFLVVSLSLIQFVYLLRWIGESTGIGLQRVQNLLSIKHTEQDGIKIQRVIKAKTYQYTFFMSDKGFSGCPLIISPGFSYLLLHFPRAQPHDVPQLLPVDRHWHFVVLHSDFLLQEQHSSLSVIFFTLSC